MSVFLFFYSDIINIDNIPTETAHNHDNSL